MAIDELAQRLFGARRAESDAILTDATTGTIHGVALTDSEDGAVTVEITADVTAPEPLEVGGETYFADAGVGVEIPTSESVRAGDEVLVSTYGAGTMRSPVVTAAVGSGDRMAASVSNAEELATEAQEVAQATGQHFWHDTDGAHVTEATREDWETAHTGANSLWNSLGMLFRDGLNNLLAVLTSGIAIYDGTGNTADHILAEFASDEVRIGGAIPEDGSAVATVRFFDSDADKGAMVEGYVSNSYSPTDENVGWGVQTQDTYTDLHTSTNDSDMEQVNGCAGTADVRLGQTTYWEDGPDGYYQAESTAKLTAAAESGTDPTQTARAEANIGVMASTLNDTTGTASIVMSADELTLTDPNAGSFIDTCTVSMSSAITAIMRPATSYTGANNTATASASGWRLTYFNTVLQSDGYPENYYTFNNGVITATKTCSLLISGSMYWNSGGTGQYGFGVFTGSTAGSGTEYSVFNYKASSSGQHQITFPPRLFRLTAGNSLCIGRYEISGAVYRNGTNMSYLTIEVVR